MDGGLVNFRGNKRETEVEVSGLSDGWNEAAKQPFDA